MGGDNNLWYYPVETKGDSLSISSHCYQISDVFISGKICATVDVKLIFYICFFKNIGKLVGMSGIFTIVVMGLFLNSTSFKPGVEALLLEWVARIFSLCFIH